MDCESNDPENKKTNQMAIVFKIMFLARPEGGSCISHTATTDNAAQKHYLEYYTNGCDQTALSQIQNEGAFLFEKMQT
ncbi:hypothetical protein DSCOOX_64010 [Desulfosarcina ovata subsp. ovata]|uniref:Uncharacterized protein n=1 Tax=Desulfosarcina ovata subsp. ovata TaxID=2752305 RepID=A0A5K8AKK1_9BACT|nr:hypothetical protein DSCOOX_64010 [Desulfosarcina ovata subsp. ovata]